MPYNPTAGLARTSPHGPPPGQLSTQRRPDVCTAPLYLTCTLMPADPRLALLTGRRDLCEQWAVSRRSGTDGPAGRAGGGGSRTLFTGVEGSGWGSDAPSQPPAVRVGPRTSPERSASSKAPLRHSLSTPPQETSAATSATPAATSGHNSFAVSV